MPVQLQRIMPDHTTSLGGVDMPGMFNYDDNAATERAPGWLPLIVTPIQPEYPCAHCMIASTIATIIRLDVGKEPLPTLSTISNTLPGVTRRWTRTEDVVQEVINARIWDGVHYRNSGEVGARMGEQVGRLVAAAYGLQP